jgi:hypothetical protein
MLAGIRCEIPVGSIEPVVDDVPLAAMIGAEVSIAGVT